MSSSSLIEMFGSSIDILSSLESMLISFMDDDAVLRCIIGVKAGEGIGDGRGVGISRIGERHLLIVLGISRRIVGGCRRLLPLLGALCALRASNTGTSIVPWDFELNTGLSEIPLEKEMGV